MTGLELANCIHMCGMTGRELAECIRMMLG